MGVYDRLWSRLMLVRIQPWSQLEHVSQLVELAVEHGRIYVGTGCVISQFNSDCQQNHKNIYTLTLKAIDFYS